MTPGQENHISCDNNVQLRPEIVPLQATPNRSSIMNASQSRLSKSIEVIIQNPNQDKILKNE